MSFCLCYSSKNFSPSSPNCNEDDIRYQNQLWRLNNLNISIVLFSFPLSFVIYSFKIVIFWVLVLDILVLHHDSAATIGKYGNVPHTNIGLWIGSDNIRCCIKYIISMSGLTNLHLYRLNSLKSTSIRCSKFNANF